MFNSNKSDSPSASSLSSMDTKPSFSGEKKSAEIDIPIHTMKKDLENINNPQYFNTPDNIAEPAPSAKISFSSPPKNMDSKPRTSPFLSQNARKENDMASTAPLKDYTPLPKINNISRPNAPIAPPITSSAPSQAAIPPASAPKTPSSIIPSTKTEKISIPPEPHTPSSWGKLILVTCVIFLLFAAGAGGYYYWTNQKGIAKTPAKTAPVPPPAPVLALDKPNYLNISQEEEKIDIAIALRKPIEEAIKEKPTTPVEFLVVDKQNGPISFKNFASKAGISLPTDVSNQLKDTFSLFVYLDEERPRVGLAIDSNDLIGTNLKKSLEENEGSLATSINPMYLNTPIVENENDFDTSYYGGAEIRFKNFDQTELISLDYTIFRDKLIISTSKMTLRSIIDYMTANGKVEGIEDVLEDIPEEELQNNSL